MGYARTVWITIGADGQLTWPEGELVVPKSFVGKVDGYPEGTVVEVHGSYERVDAHTKRLEVRRVSVAETPVERADALWRRVSFGNDPEARPEWPEFVDALHALRGEGSPAAIMLCAWRDCVTGDPEEGMRMFGEALTLDTRRYEHLVRALWKLVPDGTLAQWSPRQREELVRAVWRSLPGWDWVHPIVKSLWVPPERPLHFGGPKPDADEALLRAWIAGLAREIATPDESMQIKRIEKLSSAQRRALVARLRSEDESRYDDAYSDMVDEWSADPKNDMDSPPDDVAITWTEEARRLPARWCGLMSESTSWDDSLEAASVWLVGFWRDRRDDADELIQRIDAACILSALQPTLVARLERVVFVHATLLEGHALALLRDGRACVLEAAEGAFGPWQMRVGELDAMIDSLPDADLARIALRQGKLAWSPRSLRIETLNRPRTPPLKPPPGPPVRETKLEAPRWVVHPRHGRGLVVGSIPGPKGPKLVIEFETAGRKTLLHSFVQDE